MYIHLSLHGFYPFLEHYGMICPNRPLNPSLFVFWCEIDGSPLLNSHKLLSTMILGLIVLLKRRILILNWWPNEYLGFLCYFIGQALDYTYLLTYLKPPTYLLDGTTATCSLFSVLYSNILFFSYFLLIVLISWKPIFFFVSLYYSTTQSSTTYYYYYIIRRLHVRPLHVVLLVVHHNI